MPKATQLIGRGTCDGKQAVTATAAPLEVGLCSRLREAGSRLQGVPLPRTGRAEARL